MNCDNFQENASQFIDGRLNASDQATLFDHLSICTECRSFLSSSVRVREVAQHDLTGVPEGIDEELLERLSERHGRPDVFQNRSDRFWRREIVLSFPLAAAAMLLVVLASVLISLSLTRTRAEIPGLETVLGRSQGAGRQTVVVVYQLPEEQVVSIPPGRIFEVKARTLAD